ncbi:MAG: aldehyde dehydrogenase family protein, partial [Candidatus Marinimicrobia bacterium]|nr:aldehyde dehydrogenase family protein [Candidatus Neomarinimicrobiota bacterium]
MPNSIVVVPKPANEPIKSYAPNSPERARIKDTLKELRSTEIEIPLVIGGKEIKTGNTTTCVIPHNHQHVLATYHLAGEKEIAMAIEASQQAWEMWSTMPWESRVAIFKRMATLLAGPYRDLLNAATMLNISKNVFQAEIDSACELIDFYNFNAYYAQELYEYQPLYSPSGTWNITEHRPLEGFIFA